MRWMLLVLTYCLSGGSAFADGSVSDLMDQYRRSGDETKKTDLVVMVNRAVSKAPQWRPEVAALFRQELDSAKSLELTSILAHSWWLHEDRANPLSPETTRLVFRLLEDVRAHKHRRSSPTTPRERAIYILSTCEESVVPAVIRLLEDERPMHQAAGISVLASRGYFNSHFGQLSPFFTSQEEIVQNAVAQALRLNAGHRDESVMACFLMMSSIKGGKPFDALALAAAAQAKNVGQQKAWDIQQQLLQQCRPGVHQAQLHRAIAITMSTLSDEHQRATVKEISGSLHSRWLETAVIVAGPNGRSAVAHFLTRFQEADEKARLRRAYDLYRIERDPDRVLPLFLQGLDSTTATQRYYAFAGIRAIGSEAEIAVPKLTRMLDSDNRVIVEQSLKALAAIRTDSSAALDAVQSFAGVCEDPRLVAVANETIAALMDSPSANK